MHRDLKYISQNTQLYKSSLDPEQTWLSIQLAQTNALKTEQFSSSEQEKSWSSFQKSVES